MGTVFADLLDYAALRQVKLGIEQVFIYSVCNRQTLRDFFERVGRDDLYWNCDPGHFVYHEESFQDAIEQLCSTEEEIVEEVRLTVVHEVAHHFGIDDDRLHEMGV